MLISVGTSAARAHHHRDRRVGQPGAVLDAVDPRPDQPRQRILAEHVRGDPRALPVRGGDSGGQDLVAPQRRQIADGAVDPVADQFDPPVTDAGLLGDQVRQQDRVGVDRQPGM